MFNLYLLLRTLFKSSLSFDEHVQVMPRTNMINSDTIMRYYCGFIELFSW